MNQDRYEQEEAKGASGGTGGEYIWLRYATQFNVAARSYTIEMGLPMPIGASEEEREQLLREADAGMTQLTGYVENRVAHMLQRVQPTQGPIPTPVPMVRPSTTPPPSVQATPSMPPATPVQRPVVKPASVPVVHNAAQAVPTPLSGTSGAPAPREIRDGRDNVVEPPFQPQREMSVPPTRSIINMPLSTTGDAGGNMSLPQFLKIIHESLGLNPKQAMEMLHVKTLSGVNLREALEELQYLVTEQDANEATSATAKNTPQGTSPHPKADEKAVIEKATNRSTPPTRVDKAETPAASVATPAHAGNNASRNVPNNTPLSIPGVTMGTNMLKPVSKEPRREEQEGNVREEPPVYVFDEEVGTEEEDEDLDELEDEPEELSAEARAQARKMISQFRESRGSTPASDLRLRVLNNVIGGQITMEQLQDLIQGIWGVNSIKKLKVDQVELLISWAKTDEFLDEVDPVLTVLEEEG
jgi:hypothetical protein